MKIISIGHKNCFIYLAATTFLFLSSTMPVLSVASGDANGDGRADLADFQIWKQEYLGTISTKTADFDRSGSVNLADFSIWKNAYLGEAPTTSVPTNPPISTGDGVWISQQEIMALPTSGTAWNNVSSWANKSIGSASLNNQDSDEDAIALAKAYTCARVGEHCSEVVAALNTLSSRAPSGDRVLAWARNMSTWVITADIVINSGKSSGLNVAQFRSWVNTAINTNSDGGSIQSCHENWVNNWGTMCGGSRIASLAFLNNTAGLARAWDVFRGYVGDKSGNTYTGFNTGISCTNWRCPNDCDKHWINPKSCTKNGRNFDGANPSELHRNGEWNGSTWPPTYNTSYPFNGLAGLMVQAEVLSRQGYPSWAAADSAMLRAYSWLIDEAKWNANWASKASWMPWVINKRYNRSYPASLPVEPGQNTGFVDWTHAR